MNDNKPMTTEEREAQVNAPTTLHWASTQMHKWLSIMNNIVLGSPVEDYEKELLLMFKLRLYHQKLIDSQD